MSNLEDLFRDYSKNMTVKPEGKIMVPTGSQNLVINISHFGLLTSAKLPLQ